MSRALQGSSEETTRCCEVGGDEKKRKRMVSNRESAKRSRMKKQKRLEDLIREIDLLKKQNREVLGKIDEISARNRPVETENNVLAAQKMELEARLKYLNAIIGGNKFAGRRSNGGVEGSQQEQGFGDEFARGVVGLDRLIRPLQQTCYASHQPLMASASTMFQF